MFREKDYLPGFTSIGYATDWDLDSCVVKQPGPLSMKTLSASDAPDTVAPETAWLNERRDSRLTSTHGCKH
jgi:hypothetical protein